MKMLAYLLGARALDVATDAERGLRWPRADAPLEPIATTEATAAAWRRWRAAAEAESRPEAPRNTRLIPKRA